MNTMRRDRAASSSPDPLPLARPWAEDVPDDGFTDRVMARLPPARRRAPRLALRAAALAAAGAGLWLLPVRTFLIAAVPRLGGGGHVHLPTLLAAVAIIGTLLAASVSAVSAE
jgi:hypothetical protein